MYDSSRQHWYQVQYCPHTLPPHTHTHRERERYLRGETDLERERAGLRIGERLQRRTGGDLLGGLRARLGGELDKRADSLRDRE